MVGISPVELVIIAVVVLAPIVGLVAVFLAISASRHKRD